MIATRRSPMRSPEELKAMLAEAKQLREQALMIEKEAIRSALQQSHGIPACAGELLGVSGQTVKDWLRRNHVDLRAEVDKIRKRDGYQSGPIKASLRPGSGKHSP